MIDIIDRLDELRGAKNSEEAAAIRDILGPMPEKLNVVSRRNFMREFLSRMEELGYEKIAHGAFGAVFTKEGLSYVVKVFKNDPAYLAFVRYCLAHTDNPYVPKFRGKFMKLDAEHYAVRMERLSHSFSEEDFEAIESLFDFSYSDQSFEDYIRELQALISMPSNKEGVDGAAYILHNPGIARTVADLRSVKGLFKMDMHGGNFMKRRDTLVVVDPYVDISKI